MASSNFTQHLDCLNARTEASKQNIPPFSIVFETGVHYIANVIRTPFLLLGAVWNCFSFFGQEIYSLSQETG
jgi:hypothetical protein